VPRGREIPEDLTGLLLAWSRGDEAALERLVPLIYDDLRAIARRRLLSRRRSATLRTTELLHEAYLRLIDQSRASWHSRAHFYAVAARLMRRIVVDHIRGRQAAKRGGKVWKLPLDEAREPGRAPDFDFLALDDALGRLATVDPRQERIVELRFFAGLTIEETAAVVGISPASVKREWTMARAWLYRKLAPEAPHGV
jgi:RNA polymerase sigma factor (TIGR02999 family)